MSRLMGLVERIRNIRTHANADNRAYVAFVVVSYALSSLGGVFVNKACLSGFRFGFPITLMLCQLIFSVTALSILRALNVLEIPRRTFREVVYLLYPAVLLILNVTVGLLALKLVNIPMFSAFRRLSVINVMILEYYVLNRTATRRVLFCVFGMVCGSVIAAVGDLTFDPVGYALVFVNNFITAGNLVAIKKASQVVRLEALALFYYVSCVALPMVLTVAIASGELNDAINAIRSRDDLQSAWFLLALMLSSTSAFSVNFFTNLCTTVTSALTTAITGQTKNILQTLLGIFTWGYKVSFLNLLGLFVALIASSTFAYIKFDEGSAARATRVSQDAPDETPPGEPDPPKETVANGGAVNPQAPPHKGL